MVKREPALLFLVLLFSYFVPISRGGDDIPKVAWKRPIGAPLAAPVGGFGAGTFSRTYRGDFARWHIKGGVHKYQTVWANQFAMFQKTDGDADGVAKILMAGHPNGGGLSSWNWDYPVGAGDYYALYPKAWFDYRWEKFPAHVVLEQYSPILRNNYKESSYPIAVYRWHAENSTNQRVTVSVLLSWENMLGWFRTFNRDLSGRINDGNHNRAVIEPFPRALKGSKEPAGAAGTMKGIAFDRNHLGRIEEQWDGQFVIATLESPGVEVTYQTTFAPDRDGKEVWVPFSKDGKLANSDDAWTSSGEPLAGAIAVRFTLEPGEKRIIPMVIAWDLPIVEFGAGRKWYRHYTDFYGTSGINAWAIARDGLKNASAWSDAIDSWQAPYINDESKPLWYRGMLFNELYVLADLGSFWGRPATGSASNPRSPAVYSFMECYDYPYYETLDVRFYGSMPLLKFWPELEKGVMREFAKTVPQEANEKMEWIWKTQHSGSLNFRIRKVCSRAARIQRFSVTPGPRCKNRSPICASTIATATACRKTKVILIRLTMNGSSAERAPILADCGSRRCVQRKKLPSSWAIPVLRANITSSSPKRRPATSRSFGTTSIFATTRRANTATTSKPTSWPASGMPT